MPFFLKGKPFYSPLQMNSYYYSSRTRQLPVNIIVNVTVIGRPHINGPFSLVVRLASPAAEFKCYWDGLRSNFLVREISLWNGYLEDLVSFPVSSNF